MELTLTQIPLKEIKAPKTALKSHPERQIQQIADSITVYGFNDPIAIDENNDIIEGVGRYLAAKSLGLKQVPVIQLTHLPEAHKRAYRIAHNKICMNTGFNLEILRSEFEALIQLYPEDLPISGFEAAEVKDLLKIENLPPLGRELSMDLSDKTVVCPHCGGEVHV